MVEEVGRRHGWAMISPGSELKPQGEAERDVQTTQTAKATALDSFILNAEQCDEN